MHRFLLLVLFLGFLSSQCKILSQSDSLFIIDRIIFEGNKITRDQIIARELMFTTGDTLAMRELTHKLQKSRENLLNTSLFNFVSYDIDLEQDRAEIVFSFVERWYIWPWPVIEFADRNFNTWWTENRSLSRMSYGVMLKWGNFRGRREELDLTAVFGYDERYGIDYKIPYLNPDKTIGLGFGIYYGRTHEVPVVNEEDKLVYYDDKTEYIQQEISSYMSFIIRKHIYNTHTLRMEYYFREFDDTLNKINPAFSPGGDDRLQYLSVVYQYKSDHRDDKPYPLRGYYFDIELAKRGFGVLENGGMDVFYVLTTFRKYIQLGKRWYFASGINSRFSNESEQPFFMNRAIGYGRDIVRGYEYYVVNGYNFGILKNNIKFALLPERNFNIDFIKSEKFAKVHYAFYLNAFFDMGFVDNFYPDPSRQNDLENTMLIGYGLGIDFVTYYDLVLRIEYSVNRMNEHGLFLHFIAPI